MRSTSEGKWWAARLASLFRSAAPREKLGA